MKSITKTSQKTSQTQHEGPLARFWVYLLAYSLTHLLTVVVFPLLAQACPACKEALFDPGQLHHKLSTARGYALSIGLMLTVPLGLITAVGVTIACAQRRHRANLGGSPASTAGSDPERI